MSDLDQPEALLYRALATPLGIVVAVDDFRLAQAKLYRARRQLGDSALDVLSIRPSLDGTPNQLWIVKGTLNAKAREGAD